MGLVILSILKSPLECFDFLLSVIARLRADPFSVCSVLNQSSHALVLQRGASGCRGSYQVSSCPNSRKFRQTLTDKITDILTFTQNVK